MWLYLFDTQKSIGGLLDVLVHIGGQRQSECVVSHYWRVAVPSLPQVFSLISSFLSMAATKYSSQLEITIIYIVHNSENQNDSKLTLGPFKCYVTFFSWEFDPHPPPRNANNTGPYTFVTVFFQESWHLHSPLRYVTLEWPLCSKNCEMHAEVSTRFYGPWSRIALVSTLSLPRHI